MRQMKDSGIDWIGFIPDGWTLSKVGKMFHERSEKVSDLDYEPLSVTKYGIVPQLETSAKSNAHDDRKLVKQGDFVINSRSDRKQSCGLSNYDGSVSLINTVLINKDYHIGYVKYLFDNYGFAEEFYRWGTGIVADLWSTNFTKMKKIDLPVPTLVEQQKIANYLDKKVALIDNIIEKTKESIEEYKKLKQAIITETVTKGLNPIVKMKDSGIEWIGEIPVHWLFVPIKSIFSFSKGLNITKDDLIENGVSVVSYGQIHSKENTGYSINDSLIRYINESLISNSESSKVCKGDFIFADTSEDLEGTGNFVLNDGNELIYAGYHTVVAKLNTSNTITSKYFSYLFLSDSWRAQIRALVSGIKLFSITQKILKTPKILILPEHEMIEIIDKLDSNLKEFENIISKKNMLIEDLEIYKKSLIYEVVTGKKEVL